MLLNLDIPGKWYLDRKILLFFPKQQKFTISQPLYMRSLSSVQFSRSVVFDSLWPHGLQHTRPPYPSPTPRVHSDSCPLNRWCHPTISVVPFSSHLQSFPASGSFQMSQFFASDGQRIGVSASASVLANEYSGLIFFRIDWLDILAVQGTLKSLLQHHSSRDY